MAAVKAARSGCMGIGVGVGTGMVTVASLGRYSQAEQEALFAAIKANCACDPPVKCQAHQMLMGDQRAIDHLLFVRRVAQQFIQREHAL